MNVFLLRAWGTHEIERTYVCEDRDAAMAVKDYDKKRNPSTPVGAYEIIETKLWTLDSEELGEVNGTSS
jgi:hypothetical protein